MTHPGQPPSTPDQNAGQDLGPGPRPPGPGFDASPPAPYPPAYPYGQPPAPPYTGPGAPTGPTGGGYGQPHGPQFDQPPPSAWGTTQHGRAADQPFDPSIPSYTLSSDQFRPPRDHKPLWIVGIVVAVVALVVATSTFVAWRSDQQQADPSPAPSAPSAVPTPSGNGIDFESSEGSGRLDVVDSRWVAGGLQVKVKLTVSKGEVQYGLYNFTAFDEQGTTIDSSTQEVPVPALGEGYLAEGQTTEGWIAFQVTRQDVTLLLISEYGKAITAYKIDG